MLMSTEFKPYYLSVPSSFNSTTRNIIAIFDNLHLIQKMSIKKLGDVKLILFDENNINKIFAEAVIINGELSTIDINVNKINSQESQITYYLKDIADDYTIQALNEYFGKVINKKSRNYTDEKKDKKDKEIQDKKENLKNSFVRGNDFIFDIERYSDGLKAVQYSHFGFVRSSGAESLRDKLLIKKIDSKIKYHQCKINRDIIVKAIESLCFDDLVVLSAWYKIGININSKEFNRAVNKIKVNKKSNNNALYQRAYRNRKRSLYSLVEQIIIEQSR